MTYEWENGIRENIDELDDAVMGVDGLLPEGCTVIGLVVANMETGEAAVVRLDSIEGVAGADLWKDAAGDADAEYAKAVDAAGFGQTSTAEQDQ